MIALKQTIKVTVAELLDCHQEHESYVDLFQDKVEDSIGRELDFWQMVCYTVVGVEDGDTLLIEVEGYEEA